eukprot:m.1438417 g.1438417  ORF g.1438417 m.1438417 type:complete len:346 (-) comp25091_c0_seq8:1379-2416(-)
MRSNAEASEKNIWHNPLCKCVCTSVAQQSAPTSVNHTPASGSICARCGARNGSINDVHAVMPPDAACISNFGRTTILSRSSVSLTPFQRAMRRSTRWAASCFARVRSHFGPSSATRSMHTVNSAGSPEPTMSARHPVYCDPPSDALPHPVARCCAHCSDSVVPLKSSAAVHSFAARRPQAISDEMMVPIIQKDASAVIILPRLWMGTNSEKYAKTTGMDPPTPTPLTMRQSRNAEKLCAVADRQLPMALISRASARTFLRPNRSESAPQPAPPTIMPMNAEAVSQPLSSSDSSRSHSAELAMTNEMAISSMASAALACRTRMYGVGCLLLHVHPTCALYTCTIPT